MVATSALMILLRIAFAKNIITVIKFPIEIVPQNFTKSGHTVSDPQVKLTMKIFLKVV